MSLRKLQSIYYSVIIVAAVTLTCTGGLIEWGVAAVLVVGGVPMFSLATRAAADETLNEIEHRANRPRRSAGAGQD